MWFNNGNLMRVDGRRGVDSDVLKHVEFLESVFGYTKICEGNARSIRESLEDWANSFDDEGRLKAMQLFIQGSKENAEKVLDFATKWTWVLSEYHVGYIDGRNERACEVCRRLVEYEVVYSKKGLDNFRKCMEIPRIHRSLQQTLTGLLLSGMYCAAIELENEYVVDGFKAALDANNDYGVIRRLGMPLV